jgi:uncharacterized protein DUF2784
MTTQFVVDCQQQKRGGQIPIDFKRSYQATGLMGLPLVGAVVLPARMYSALAVLVLLVHALFILWVIGGALLARSRPILRRLHIASLAWGMLTEILPWPCPLTLLENWLEGRAGVEPYQGGFLLHYLDKLIYPDISGSALTTAAVIICALNLVYYSRPMWTARR